MHEWTAIVLVLQTMMAPLRAVLRLLFFLIAAITALLFLFCRPSFLTPDTTRATSTKGRCKREIDVLL